MNNFFKKYREVVALLVWLLVVAALVWLVILPLKNHINAVKDQIQEEILNQQITRQHLSELPKIQQQYSTVEKNGNTIDVLLDKANAVTLIERLEKIADDSNAKITILVQDAPQQKTQQLTAVKGKTTSDNSLLGDLPSTNYLQLKINLNGNYNSVVRFIDVLEHFEYYSDIIDVDLKKDGATNSSSNQANANNNGLNPFDLSANTNQATAQQTAPDDKLDATLDVVFYTK